MRRSCERLGAMPPLAVKDIGALGAPHEIHLGAGTDRGLDFIEHTDARTW